MSSLVRGGPGDHVGGEEREAREEGRGQRCVHAGAHHIHSVGRGALGPGGTLRPAVVAWHGAFHEISSRGLARV